MGSEIAEVRGVVGRLYCEAPLFPRALSLGRPSICPFHVLAGHVPAGASVLDIGCGSGLFMNYLAYHDRIRAGFGFDASGAAIALANSALAHAGTKANVSFHHREIEAGLPDGQFDVVSMIDVLHHVDPAAQREAIETAIGRVAPGGTFLYKDIGKRPLWRAWANRLHDLVLARQWIHYVATDDVVAWARAMGLTVAHRETINMLWYGHELAVLRKPGGTEGR